MLVSIRFCTVLGLLALLAVSASLLADESELVEPGIRKRVDESFTRFEALGFHETVLVATGVGVVLRKEYGSADRKRGVRNSSATAFGIVSLDKQFMSDAILILEQEGKPKTSG